MFVQLHRVTYVGTLRTFILTAPPPLPPPPTPITVFFLSPMLHRYGVWSMDVWMYVHRRAFLLPRYPLAPSLAPGFPAAAHNAQHTKPYHTIPYHVYSPTFCAARMAVFFFNQRATVYCGLCLIWWGVGGGCMYGRMDVCYVCMFEYLGRRNTRPARRFTGAENTTRWAIYKGDMVHDVGFVAVRSMYICRRMGR